MQIIQLWELNKCKYFLKLQMGKLLENNFSLFPYIQNLFCKFLGWNTSFCQSEKRYVPLHNSVSTSCFL